MIENFNKIINNKSFEKVALIKSEITLYQKDNNCQTVTIQELSLAQINKTKIIGFYETNKYFI